MPSAIPSSSPPAAPSRPAFPSSPDVISVDPIPAAEPGHGQPVCPLCGAPSRALFEAHGYPVLECEACRHRFAGVPIGSDHVDAIYGDRYFDGGGAGYDDYGAERDLIIAHGRRYADLLARHGVTPGRMLDIGASCGFVIEGFRSRGWEPIGLEPNAAMAARGREAGLDIRVGTAEALPASLADGSVAPFDLVSIIQVLAHFHDPRLALGNLQRLTRPGGWWLIETWNYRSPSARLAGRHWHEYSPPSVLHWYSPARLGALLGEYGLTAVARGRPRKALRGSHARSALEHKLGNSTPGRWLRPLTRLIPPTMVIPYPADDVFWLLGRRDRG